MKEFRRREIVRSVVFLSGSFVESTTIDYSPIILSVDGGFECTDADYSVLTSLRDFFWSMLFGRSIGKIAHPLPVATSDRVFFLHNGGTALPITV